MRKGYVSTQLAKSIIDRSGGCCEICGSSNACQIHHILRRFVKPTYENLVMLCWEHHLGTAGVHGKDGHQLDVKLKKELQAKLFDSGLSEEEVRENMGGKLYLLDKKIPVTRIC